MTRRLLSFPKDNPCSRLHVGFISQKEQQQILQLPALNKSCLPLCRVGRIRRPTEEGPLSGYTTYCARCRFWGREEDFHAGISIHALHREIMADLFSRDFSSLNTAWGMHACFFGWLAVFTPTAPTLGK